jgi:hypothetical protein
MTHLLLCCLPPACALPQDFKRDVENCGKCGVRCAPGFGCANGVCDNEKPCPKGQNKCNGKCVVSATQLGGHCPNRNSL